MPAAIARLTGANTLPGTKATIRLMAIKRLVMSVSRSDGDWGENLEGFGEGGAIRHGFLGKPFGSKVVFGLRRATNTPAMHSALTEPFGGSLCAYLVFGIPRSALMIGI